MKEIRLTTYNEGPYLAYGFKMEGKDVYSGFGLTKQLPLRISKLLPPHLRKDFLEGIPVEVEDHVLISIQNEWFKSRYKKFRDVYVSRKADIALVKTAYAAYETGSPVMIQYEEGYGMYPEDDENANVSDDGLTHVAYIGKSTGTKPVLLHLESQCASGGSEFMFFGIKSLKRIGGALCA